EFGHRWSTSSVVAVRQIPLSQNCNLVRRQQQGDGAEKNSHASVNIVREMSALLIYPDSLEARERASKVVAAGGLVAFRTDTFYGIGADPFTVEALDALNNLN